MSKPTVLPPGFDRLSGDDTIGRCSSYDCHGEVTHLVVNGQAISPCCESCAKAYRRLGWRMWLVKGRRYEEQMHVEERR